MRSRIAIISDQISKIGFVQNFTCEENDGIVSGRFDTIYLDTKGEKVTFEVDIYSHYPAKLYDSESIKFINVDYIAYKHVMEDGKICIHTQHSTVLSKKLLLDFQSLEEWIGRYILEQRNDLNYEHLIVPESLIQKEMYSFTFTDVDCHFSIGQYGYVEMCSNFPSLYRDRRVNNFVVQKFVKLDRSSYACGWSNYYNSLPSTNAGYYLFIGNAPAEYGKFIYKSWGQFHSYMPNDFRAELYGFEKRAIAKNEAGIVPVFIGYSIPGELIHWQIAMLKVGEFPFYGVAEKVNGRKTGKWVGATEDKEICWALSNNSSYKNFFGRGKMDSALIGGKVLVLGVGAIGSLVCETIVRGGCRYIEVLDYDKKENGNICRSAYNFVSGIGDKTVELSDTLTRISPFVEVRIGMRDLFSVHAKSSSISDGGKQYIETYLNSFDIIFDCTTDDDLMYLLSRRTNLL